MELVKRTGKKFIPTKTDVMVVRALLLCGVPLLNICQHVVNPETGKPISYATLSKTFKKEISTAVDHCNARVVANLYRLASKEADTSQVVQAMIFWMRTRGGWKLTEASAAPPAESDTTPMVENEETARAIVEDVLNKYGRRRLTG
jgi:hypothetical protein